MLSFMDGEAAARAALTRTTHQMDHIPLWPRALRAGPSRTEAMQWKKTSP